MINPALSSKSQVMLVLFLLIFFICVIGLDVQAQPKITGFSIDPPAVDVTNDSAEIKVSIIVKDFWGRDVTAYVKLTSPTGTVESCQTTLVGTHDAKSSYCWLTIPRYSERGAWKASIELAWTRWIGQDRTRHYTSGDLAYAGFNSYLVVVNRENSRPVLGGFDFNPKSVDVSNGSATVSATLLTADDLSGVQRATVRFESPSGTQLECTSDSPDSGTRLLGTYSCSVTLPQSSEEGYWRASVWLEDAVGSSQYSAEDLAYVGYPTRLSVFAEIALPELVNFDINPRTLGAYGGFGGETVSVTLAVNAVSEIQGGTVYINSPSGHLEYCTTSDPETGTRLNGTYSCSVILPRVGLPPHIEVGTWTAAVRLYDAGRSVYYNANDLANAGFNPYVKVESFDTRAPRLVSFSINPGIAYVSTETSQSVWVAFDLAVSSSSELEDGSVILTSPGWKSLSCSFDSPGTGNRLDGTYRCGIWFRPDSEEGIWRASVRLQDVAGTSVEYSAIYLASAGFPSFLEVMRDEEFPDIQYIDISPKTVDVSTANATVSVTLTTTDNLSGVDLVTVSFKSPSGSTVGCSFNYPTTGNRLSGSYSCNVTIPQYSEAGSWDIIIRAEDVAGNSRLRTTAQGIGILVVKCSGDGCL